MKTFIRAMKYSFILICFLILNIGLHAQNIGFGTLTPDYRLHILNTTPSLLKLENSTTLANGVNTDIFFKTGTWHTGAIKSIGTEAAYARLGFFTYASLASTGLLERLSILDDGKVGIGTTTPGYLLDVNGRMRMRNGGGSAGTYLANTANNFNVAFIGLYDDLNVGIQGFSGAGWGLVMNTASGNVGIGNVNPNYRLHVTSSLNTASYFECTAGTYQSKAVYGQSTTVGGNGVGVYGIGGDAGVEGVSVSAVGGTRYGVRGYGSNGLGANYGIHGTGSNGDLAVGVYGTAAFADENWGGYFNGNVFCTGTYQGSDRKLKSNIDPLTNALDIIRQLKPSQYTFRTTEYKQLHLPVGIQYGLIADEVLEVVPGSVTKTTLPAEYENHDELNGRKLSDMIEFNSVNYTTMVPVLIAGMQEQQLIIELQNNKIQDLESRLLNLEKQN